MDFLSLVVTVSSLAAPSAAQAANPCPTDPKGIQSWRDRLMVSLEIPYEPKFGFNASSSILDCEKKNPALFQREEVKACMARMKDFLGDASKSPALAPPPPSKSEDDPDVRSQQLPDDLQDPAFLKLMTHRSTQDQAKAHLKKINAAKPENERYEFVEFTSQFVVSPDEIGSPDRLVIFIPGSKQVPEDRWVLFSSNPKDDDVHPARMVSVVTVQKTGAKGKPLPKQVVRFKTYMRNYGQNAQTDIQVKEPSKPLPYEMKCYSCHKVGVRTIIPQPGSVPEAELPTLRKLNGIIGKYRIGSFGGHYVPEKWGPPMDIDSQSSPGSQAEFKACVNRYFDNRSPKPAFQMSRVLAAARCTDCHDGDQEGILNFPIGGMSHGGDQVYEMVVGEKRMPADAHGDLTDDEREAVARCLVKDYYGGIGAYRESPKGKLASWLTQYGCATPAAPGDAPSAGTKSGTTQ